MSAVERPSVSGLPALPADVWAAVARATLRAEGDRAHAWERLRRMNSIWRAALEGVPLVVKFRTFATQEQVNLLLTTTLPLRSLTFAPCDPASCVMLRQPAILETCHETLEELHHLCVAKVDTALRLPPVRSLTRFGALRSLTLHEHPSLCAYWLRRVPVSLQSLTLVVAPFSPRSIWRSDSTSPERGYEWSLVHLTRLTELTLDDRDPRDDIMVELLRCRASPTLPASLLTLRQKSWKPIRIRASFRTRPLAAVTVPVLELEGRGVALYFCSGRARDQNAGEVPEVADLPGGFHALWLRTARIALRSAEHLTSAAVAGVAAQPTEELCRLLCRFFGVAPRCYQEFRLFADGDLSISMSLHHLSGEADESSESTRFHSLKAAATAMERLADGFGLTVSVSNDQTHVLVTRP